MHGEVVMHIHVVDVCCRVHRDLVSCELLHIIKRWPVFGLSDNFGHFLELAELWRSVESVPEHLQHSSALS